MLSISQWVFQTTGSVFDSRQIMVVSRRALVFKCSCATLVQVCRPVLILEKKTVTHQGRFLHKVAQGIETINEGEFFSFRSLSYNVNERYV